jgi:CRP/FNR family cyclic AMP-dependent transcriptional regulator
MIERFQGDEGRRRLIDALTNQTILRGDVDLATSIADCGILAEHECAQVLIEDGAHDNNLLLILTGSVDVVVNGRVVATRSSGEHVGEMALIDPSAARCATVIATGTVVSCSVSEPDFTNLAQGTPELWRRIALELGARLRQRNSLVISPNPRPHLFIGSSVESLPVARAIQLGLEHDDVTVKVWSDGVFGASDFTIQALEAEVRTADFGLMVLAPDDKVVSRDTEEEAPRDNVIFELGMCMGALTHNRTFFVYPRDAHLKIPSDLLGLTPLTYKIGKDGDFDSALGAVCERLRRAISNLGVK